MVWWVGDLYYNMVVQVNASTANDTADDNEVGIAEAIGLGVLDFDFDWSSADTADSHRLASATVLTLLFAGVLAVLGLLAFRGRKKGLCALPPLPPLASLMRRTDSRLAQDQLSAPPLTHKREETEPIVPPAMSLDRGGRTAKATYATFGGVPSSAAEDAAWVAALDQWHAAVERSRELALPTPERNPRASRDSDGGL